MAGPIRIAILANGRQARAEIGRTAASADLLGRSVSRAGKLIAAGFAIDKLVHGAAAVIKTGGDYVETLNKIQAITGASQKQIDAGASGLEAQASQYAKMGETGNDAADGVLELAKAGLSLKSSLKAVYPTMVLAKSGQLEVADASALVANTLNTFNLKAKDAARISNSLANAADISSANVADLAESFKFVAPLAAKSHVSLEQTNAILAELANSGVKASNAGTGFRKFLASLQAPVGKAAKSLQLLGVNTFDAEGKMRPLGAIIDDLHSGLAKLTEQDQAKALRNIFGLTGITSAQIILKNGSAGLEKYTKGVQRADGAARLANASSKGLAGTLKSLRAETITEADALYRRYSPAVDKALRQVIASAKKELPDALSRAKKVLREAEPTLESLASTARDLAGDVEDLATGPLGQDLVKALKLANGLTKTASDLLGGLPDPIKKIGIEALIASRVLPRLTGGLDRITSSAKAQVASLSTLRSEITLTQLGLKKVALAPGEVVPDLSGVVTPNVAALQKQYQGMKLVESQSINTRAALGKLADASRGAAGVGGLLALSDGASRGDSALGGLETAAGGAALGFSMGGPWGALVGGAGGGLIAALNHLSGSTKDANEQFAHGKQPAADYAATLDALTGKVTAQTRATIENQLATSGALSAARSLGLSNRQVVGAVLGNRAAIDAVNGALQRGQSLVIAYRDQWGSNYVTQVKNQKQADQLTASLKDQGFTIDDVSRKQIDLAGQKALLNFISTQTNEWQQASKAKREEILSSQDLSSVYKNFPKRVATRIDATGIVPTLDGIARVAAKYGTIDKKHVRALIQATGTDVTVKQVQRVIDQLVAAGKVKVQPDLKGGVDKAVSGAKGSADKGGRQLVDILEQHLAKTKASMPQLSPSVRQATDAAKGPASQGGQGIGTSVKTGFGSGFAGAITSWSAEVRAAVNAAIAAGRAAAKAHSPSEETARLGQDLADGLAVGMARRKHKDHDAGRDMITAAFAGILAGTASGSDDIGSELDALSKRLDTQLDRTLHSIKNKYDRIEKGIRARLKGAAETRAVNANDSAEHAAEQAAKKDRKELNELTKKYRDQLHSVGLQQDIINKQLEDAKSNLQALVDTAQQYADSIRDAVVASGSLSTLGQGDGFSSVDDLIAKRTAAVARAKQFADDIQALIAAGLNASDIQDLLAQGVEGGLGTAEALLKAGPDAVKKMNDLSAQLQATGTKLGANVSNTLYGAGIQAAQGLVDGLTAQSDELAASATKLAKALVKAVKKALGISSPSRVFKQIGQNAVDGLGLGLDQVYVKRQGQDLARSLQSGFGTPALAAYASGGSQGFTGQLRITGAQMDQLSRGKAIIADIDVAKGAGVRVSS